MSVVKKKRKSPEKNIRLICLQCRSEVMKSKKTARFCSIKCRDNYKYKLKKQWHLPLPKKVREKLSLFCVECSAPIVKESHGKYCSNKCGARYRKKHGNSIRGNYIEKKCILCNKAFYTPLNKSKWRNTQESKYCSKKCMFKGNRATRHRINKRAIILEYVCKYCHTTQVTPSHRRRKFCNQDCFRKWRRIHWKSMISKLRT